MNFERTTIFLARCEIFNSSSTPAKIYRYRARRRWPLCFPRRRRVVNVVFSSKNISRLRRGNTLRCPNVHGGLWSYDLQGSLHGATSWRKALEVQEPYFSKNPKVSLRRAVKRLTTDEQFSLTCTGRRVLPSASSSKHTSSARTVPARRLYSGTKSSPPPSPCLQCAGSADVTSDPRTPRASDAP